MIKGGFAVVTGAASGIGEALAVTLDRLGVGALALLDIDRDGLERVAAGLTTARTSLHPVDLGDGHALTKAFDEIGRLGRPIDFLFNNAGIPAGTPAWPDTGLDRIARIIQVNLLGVIQTTRLALPLMRRPGGSILNTASVSGLRPYLSGAVYAASKAGVIMFTQSCADLADRDGVRVNAICPGIVDTAFLDKTGTGGKRADWLVERLKAGGVLSSETVARAAIELACDETRAGQFEVLEAAG
jgi:NAD(P)-dependent dehydrogenase (short-subunit alcohol dehydrogenase family)